MFNLRHGGHVLEEDADKAHQLARTQASITMGSAAVEEVTFTTPFDYLFPQLMNKPAAHLPANDPAKVVAGLNALGAAMIENAPPPTDPREEIGNSTIPPIYTYWGQFIDHDLTANTDRKSDTSDITKPDLTPVPPDEVVKNLRNLRMPKLNLDSVYGDGPGLDPKHPTRAASFYDGIMFKVGQVAEVNNDSSPISGDRIPPEGDDERDLPRIDKKAQIADARNDENLIVAQLHTAFLRFHNAAVKRIGANGHEHKPNKAELFKQARQLTRWHYQWLVVNDFLRTVTLPGIVDKVLLDGAKHYQPRDGKLFMPLEFSVAAYRFGHSMVRAVYDHNRNFGHEAKVLPNAPFNLIFAFTGRADPAFVGRTDVLPFNWIVEWDRFINKGSSSPDHFARKIDTRLVPPLTAMKNQVTDPTLEQHIKDLLMHLARRNLLRGYSLSIPTGQSVAGAMGVAPLSSDELGQGNNDALNQVLTDNGFLERTPLWYYVLKEAEVRANGNSLGELGSRIVCETMIGLLHNDPKSYLNHKDGWNPAKGVRLPKSGDPIVTIGDFLKFAGVAP